MQTTSSLDQPAPKHNDKPQCWPEVIKDMEERHRVGIARYGTPLQPFNGRNAPADFYAELLDACVYGKQLLIEREETLEVLRDLVAAIKPEINEKGAGGYLLARLSDAESLLNKLGAEHG